MLVLFPLVEVEFGGQILASSTDGDPGIIFGCGHQFRFDLYRLPVQLVQLQFSNQRAEQNGGDGVGKPEGEIKPSPVRTSMGIRHFEMG